ncbi:unnamed protein product [Umbelopsis vinacea]
MPATINPYEVLKDDASTSHPEQNISVPQDDQVRSKFFTRLASFPVVRDSLTTMYQYVNENSLGRYALTSTEDTLQKASVIIAPYVERFSDQLKTMDEIGYKSLDYVEQNYSIVNKPTAEILAPVRQVQTTAKGYLDTTVHVVTWPVDRAAQNVLDNLEYAVDRVLPPQDAHNQQRQKKEVSQQKRVYSLALDTKSRLMSRLAVVDQIPRSRTELQQTLAANQLLQGAFDRLQRLDLSLRQTTEVTKRNLATPITHQFDTLSKQMQDRYEAACSFTDQRINAVTAEMVNHLDNTIAYIQKHNHVFPQSVRTRLQPLVSFASQEYDIVRDQVLNTDISSVQKAKNVLALSKNYMLPLLKDSMDALHEELRYYQVYADKSRTKALNTLRGHFESVGGQGIKA